MERTLEEKVEGGKALSPEDAGLRSILKAKREKIEFAKEEALKAFHNYKALVTNEYAKTSLAIPTTFKHAEDAISAIDLNQSWASHSAALLKNEKDFRATMTALMIEARMKYVLSKQDEKTIATENEHQNEPQYLHVDENLIDIYDQFCAFVDDYYKSTMPLPHEIVAATKDSGTKRSISITTRLIYRGD